MSFVYPYHRAFFPVVLVVPPYSYKVIQNISFILEVTAVNTALEVHWCTPLELVDWKLKEDRSGRSIDRAFFFSQHSFYKLAGVEGFAKQGSSDK